MLKVRKVRTALMTITAVTCLLSGSSLSHAAPFVPGRDSLVLERLPASAANPALDELRRLRKALADDPHDLTLAVALARGYLELERGESDPRYAGYAEAVLSPWLDQPDPPVQARLLRATLRQRQHDLDGALDDLSRVLAIRPRNAQAWLTRAVVLRVRGEFPEALRSCLMLSRLRHHPIATVCTASIASLTGQAENGYRLIQQVLDDGTDLSTPERLWALTVLAEIAARLGRPLDAERHFRRALGLGVRDVYLLGAYTDFLLDQGRAREIRRLLKDDTRPDALLLQLALAEQKLDASELQDHIKDLRTRLAAIGLRGDNVHLRTQARFNLDLLKKPAEALRIAQKNWAAQREPADSRLVLEAALTARNPEAAQPVLDWLAQTRLEDVRLGAIAKRLEEIAQ